MKVLTNLNLTNLRQNRSRTIMTIVGVALSVALILSMIGLATSLSWTERQEAIAEYGDIHVMYKDVPGNVVHVIEEDSNFELKYYANQIECNEDRYLETCSYWNPYPREEYEPIVDAHEDVLLGNFIVPAAAYHLYSVYAGVVIGRVEQDAVPVRSRFVILFARVPVNVENIKQPYSRFLLFFGNFHDAVF